MSLTITLSGPKVSESQARNALVAARFDNTPPDHDYGLPAVSDQQAESFITVIGDDVDKAWDAVRSLGWRLRIHHETPDPHKPGPFELLSEVVGHHDSKVADLEARIARLEGNPPPIAGGAVESPPAFIQASTYGAEITRRSIGALLQRSANIGTPVGGLVAATDMQLTAPVSGMSVNVAPGEAYVAGSSAATQGAYYCRVSSTTNLAVAASDPTNPRIDRVSAIVTDAAYTGVTNTFAVAVETGTPTASATLANPLGEAAAPASSLTLGIVLVPNTSTNVITANISNVAAEASLGLPLLSYVNGSSNLTVVPGQWVEAAAGVTITLPTINANVMVAVTAAPGVSGSNPVTVSGGAIYGEGLSGAASFKLGIVGASVILQASGNIPGQGTKWYIISGEQDTGWVSLAAGGGVSQGTGYALTARLRGDTVRLSGQGTGTAITTWATIPAGLRPSSQVSGGPGSSPTYTISTAGVITTPSGQNAFGFDSVAPFRLN